MPLQPLLDRVEARLHELTEYDFGFCSEVTRSLVEAGGKRMRPRMALRFGLALDVDADVLVDAAAAVELVHNGTLLQDDVIDQSDTRRGEPTAWKRWGAGAGVLGGNLVYMRAYGDLLRRGHALEALWLVDALEAVVIGEMLQQQQSWLTEPDEQALITICRHKTGAFFGYACQVVAHHAGTDAQAAREWGIRLGYGFQLADDLLDFGGPIDKPVCKDLREGYQTLPVYREAVQNLTLRQAISRAYAARVDGAFDEAYRVITESDIRERTLTELRELETTLREDLAAWAPGEAALEVAGELIEASFYRAI